MSKEREDNNSSTMKLYKRGYNMMERAIGRLKYVRCESVHEMSNGGYVKYFGSGVNARGVVTNDYWIIVSVFDFNELTGLSLNVSCIGYKFQMYINGGVVLEKDADGTMSLYEFEEFCEGYWDNRKGVYLN